MRPACGAPRARALATTATVALAACGGASEDDYRASLGSFCTEVRQAQRTLATEVRRVREDPKAAADPERSLRGNGRALEAFADRLRGGLRTFRDTEVPEDLREFHTGATRGIDRYADEVDAAAAALADGKLEVLDSFGTRLRRVRFPEVPPELRESLRSCGDLGARRTGRTR